MRLGIIGGTNLFGTKLLEGAQAKEVKTIYGSVYLLVTAACVFIPRHGKATNIPPHRINHRANIMAFKELGIEEVIGTTSAGSLKRDIKPRSLVVPHDYINLCSIPTFYEHKLVHITPSLDEGLRTAIITVAKEVVMDRLVKQGVYFQTPGPRLETRAEINFIKSYADVVGMSMASEATLANELGLRYANISTVDNYAHGIVAGEVLDYKQIVADAAKSKESLEKVLERLMETGKIEFI